ncbi:hypothetical protein FNV64_45360 [Streptomyces sp. S1A1-7]|uniref:hypothetical protein n=1 Tax=unclassified Streptomyces TaxID=2593676 RepID=UPI001163F9F2|nr:MULTISPECIES: hypothetical protein [unclassified Streptomyces]QDN81823.1 hypothetical protein FNV64_45360 [Streptomyces sp. S1A1-7]QDN87401.1 hypothetical protein FNV61_18750 [Streptomyces sp. RLB3-6]
MVSYGPDRAALKEEARQMIRELQAAQAEQAANDGEPVPDGYYGWDSTPADAVGSALAELGIHRTAYRPEN